MKYKELIPVANTFIGKEEAQAAYDTIMSGWVSKGPKTDEFEKKFAEEIGVKHAISANNGTTALHAILAAMKIKQGDEVIVPTITFISTANAVLYQNAKPVLVECDPDTYNVTADIIEAAITPKTKAIIPVDMNGMPVDYDAIMEIGEKHNIPVIADSAESLGATYKGKKIGSIAPIQFFSFFPNKNLTTGEGGMITTDDDELAKEITILINQGQDYRYHHIRLGYNYRMNNILASIGIEQLKRLKSVVEEKEKLAQVYNKAFKNCKNIHAPYLPDYVTQHAWYMYAVSVDGDRDKIVKQLEERNIQTRLSFPPIHAQPIYKELFGYKNDDFPVSMQAWKKLINIPIWVGMGQEKQQFVIDTLMELCE